ncbi:MAG: hypothetical protein ACRDJC_12605 [Thermomicrobiales bacterium]
MDGDLFDHFAKNLAGQAPRRDAVRAFAAGGLATVGSRLFPIEAGAKKKRRCRKFGQTCGGKKKCCKKKGPASCEEFGNSECFDVELTGRRCCGQEGAICNPNFGTPGSSNPDTFGNCSCCQQLFCGKQPNGQFRCQSEDT